jgi:hypothetical protein
MSEPYTKVRVVQKGGVAGTLPLVDLDRNNLDEARSQSMDEACRDLLALADRSAAAAPEAGKRIGADLPSYQVEIEAKDGKARTFTIPSGGLPGSGHQGALGSFDAASIVQKLQSLAPSSR